MSTAPNIDNLTIPKGVATFTPDGGSLTDLGEVSNFTYAAEVTKKDFWSGRSGIRTKVKSVVSQLGATCRLTCHEVNDFNMALYLLAETGTSELIGLTSTALTGTLTFTGANSVGSQTNFSALVQVQPGGDMSLITDGDDWQAIPLNFEVLYDSTTGGYGTWSFDDEPTA